MDSSQLRPEQFDLVLRAAARQRDYLWRLVERMRVRKFPADDPVYRAALGAYEKSSNFCVVLASCRERMSPRDPHDTIMTQRPWGGERR